MAIRIVSEKVLEVKDSGDVIVFLEGYCDSSDTKPTVNVAEGSNLIETDTGDWYFFNEPSGVWIKELTIQE